MKKTIYLPLVALVAVFLIITSPGCRPRIQQNSANNLPATLVFGQGGGVTGKYLEYSLVIDGTIYRHDVEKSQKTFYGTITHKDCRVFFAEAERLHLFKMDFNHPHNINYYIIYKKGVSENKVNWGNSQMPPPEGVQELWDKLWALTK
jgi:hypothetical protein